MQCERASDCDRCFYCLDFLAGLLSIIPKTHRCSPHFRSSCLCRYLQSRSTTWFFFFSPLHIHRPILVDGVWIHQGEGSFIDVYNSSWKYKLTLAQGPENSQAVMTDQWCKFLHAGTTSLIYQRLCRDKVRQPWHRAFPSPWCTLFTLRISG